jgi:hypothetical protein
LLKRYIRVSSHLQNVDDLEQSGTNLTWCRLDQFSTF